MVGGTVNIPIVNKTIWDAFTTEYRTVNKSKSDPQLMIVEGAAVLAGSYAFDCGFNPDKCGENDNIYVHLEDAIPLDLGVGTCPLDTTPPCHKMDTLLARNSPYGTKHAKLYVTSLPGDTSITIYLYEGNSNDTDENYYVGRLSIKNIDPSRRSRKGQLQQNLEIDANGIATFQAIVFNDNIPEKDRIFTMQIAVDKDKSLKGEELRTQWVEMMDILHVSEKDREECEPLELESGKVALSS